MDSAGAGRSVRQTTGLGSRPAPRGGLRPVTAGAAVIVVVAAGFTPPGRAAIAGSFAFLEFFTGVFSLVGLSITVLLGLAATDRLVLLIRHRILLQLAHRATAATALVCLAIHVATKLVEGHAHLWDPAIPFLASHRPVQVGLGTLAGYLMIIATWTGVTRASYAGSRQPGRWRILHASAYAAWLLALIHGLGAGRSAKTWVLVSYGICLALVALALLVRFFVAMNRRTHLARAQTIRRMRPVGRPATAEATPLATNVLIPSLDGTEWADAERRPTDHDDPRPAAASAGRKDTDPAREEPRARLAPVARERARARREAPEDRVPPAAARRLDDTAEITDEEFWAYIRNEVGR
ncbi:ferric reductase-like transmembrane domain-containing protein [Micromonospora sp. NPDC050495]|uniref:ferric reductase-like transmembrane domain-containing protein n=1 Tax=Micromonospora sp. NPDC050495 TaxID=3154936 RepID=UPI0033C8FDC5